MLRIDRTDRLSAVAIATVPVHAAQTEVHVVGVVRIASIERTQPIVAIRPSIIKRAYVHVPCSGQLF